MRRHAFIHTYGDIISLENLLDSWQEFVCGKSKRGDVLVFERNVMDNLIVLHRDLVSNQYRHGGYHAFRISDPKPREIHKASVRDRIVHRALYRTLYPYFDARFIYDSYSCRIGKGTHKAINRFRDMARIVSRNNTKTVWVLKCDVKKFFASIDHPVLVGILKEGIVDYRITRLLEGIVDSFSSDVSGRGLPLGNLTSQLLANVYMNEFDHYMKHDLHVAHYIRYADDFVVLSRSRTYLESLLTLMRNYLWSQLALHIHPNKVWIKTLASGVDFLGWVHFPHHRTLRTATKRRMIRSLADSLSKETIASYRGLLSHGNTCKLQKLYW